MQVVSGLYTRTDLKLLFIVIRGCYDVHQLVRKRLRPTHLFVMYTIILQNQDLDQL